MRNGCSATSSSISTVSKCSMNVGPVYHGVRALGSTTLSPRSAEIGMTTTSSMAISAANAR